MRHAITVLSTLLLAAAPVAAETLLIGNKGEDTLSLVALDTGAELARLPTGKMPHEIAISPDGKQAAVVAYGATTIDVFDVAEHKKLRDISIGGKPEGLALAKGGRELWVGDLAAPRVSVWDVATGEKIVELPVDPVAIRVLASPDGRLIATSNIGAGTISLFDAETRAPLKTIKVSGEQKKGQVTLLFSADSKRLYAAETGHDMIAEIDVASGEVLRRIAAGKNGDGLAIAP